MPHHVVAMQNENGMALSTWHARSARLFMLERRVATLLHDPWVRLVVIRSGLEQLLFMPGV